MGINEQKDNTTISDDEYDELLKDSVLLNCLREVGVDNWDGWDDAITLYNDRISE